MRVRKSGRTFVESEQELTTTTSNFSKKSTLKLDKSPATIIYSSQHFNISSYQTFRININHNSNG